MNNSGIIVVVVIFKIRIIKVITTIPEIEVILKWNIEKNLYQK